MTRPATRRRLAAATLALIPLLALAGCVVPTTNLGVTFLAESTSLCASPDLTDAVVGVGIEVHGSKVGRIDSVTASDKGQTVKVDTWLLDAFPANQSTAYPANGVAGWSGRQDPAGSQVAPGSHTIVVRIQQGQAGHTTSIDQLAIAYTLDGDSGIALSTTGIGFGTPGDHACD